jgi:ATP-dependent Lon protease
VGGVKEKIHAALRAGVKKVILPGKNQAHLEEIPGELLKSVEIVFVSHIDEVFREALTD